MPLPLLLALFLAFGFDSASGETPPPPLSSADSFRVVGLTTTGVLLVGGFAWVAGWLVARSIYRNGRASPRNRRAQSLAIRVVDLLGLVVYGAILHELGWADVIRRGFGMADFVLLDEALILLPFLLIQVLGWWGLYPAQQALWLVRSNGHAERLGRHLWLKARQSMGMVLPVAAVYGLGTDLLHWVWPESRSSTWEQPISLGVMGLVVLSMAPALVRLAWPTHPLPPGPLRDRLERLARRVGFRCTDILVWDTNLGVVNAGVTGALPWFRYVLLTDALIDHLSPYEVAAVFGHEIGHIAHRHLVYFGFFILGSLGFLSVAEMWIGAWPTSDWLAAYPTATLVGQSILALILVGGYFLVVFGFLSRRFERQADVFGCRVVSCGSLDCPPHGDLDGRSEPSGALPRLKARRATAATPLCPVGIRIFIGALSRVAMLNGMQPRRWCWRHGSIVRRVEFLEGLIGRPEVERRFQSGVNRLRLVTATLLVVALGAVLANGYWR
ncbi:MAG: M48 family metallopeptidase [Isosphaeraceae bacterium]